MKYKVVRSFAPNCETSCSDLEKAFEEGYQFIRASEFIPPQDEKAGYIEYILCKYNEEEYEDYVTCREKTSDDE